MTQLSDIGEFGFIERIAKRVSATDDVIKGIGDDCAVLRCGTEILLVTSDLSIEDVHFRRARTRPEDIGWKALAVSLSDIAAMGGRPRFVTASVAAPADCEVALLDGILTGLLEAADYGGAVLTGGDTTRSREGLVLDTMVIGIAPNGRYLTRDGAKDGDVLMVTGSPGDAGAGLHAQEHAQDAPHLLRALHHPMPRIREGAWLAAQDGVHAMIDVSDGLGQDAGHIAKASAIGVDIALHTLPVGTELARYCDTQRLDPHRVALSSGDAYELAIAVDSKASEGLRKRFSETFEIDLTPVGVFSDTFRGLRVNGDDSDARGFDHFHVHHDG